MKRLIYAFTAVFFASCSGGLQVEVANDTNIERDNETIEIAWNEVTRIGGITPENVVVLDDDGKQIPSQVIYLGTSEPKALIFQADVDGNEKEMYTIQKGVRENYEQQAFGRYVPERLDDYAWENNLVGYRIYGPDLENVSDNPLTSPGIDVWVKCKEKLVIDEWYATGDYHHNYGDGMDCYKVGVSLGGGASAPFVDQQLRLSGNYAAQQTLDNGPIRTSVKLSYAPVFEGDKFVILTKYITLDANQRFNRIEDVYEGNFESMPIAAGFVRHDVKGTTTSTNYLAMCEAVSDSDDPARDGDIYFGIVLPGAEFISDVCGHALAVKSVKSGEKLTYRAGSGWSQGGVDDMNDWIETIQEQEAAAVSPLRVTIR